MAIVITADEQDVYPPRVLVSVTGLVGSEFVDIYRVVAGERVQIRGGFTIADDVAFLVLDAELPFGIPVSYVVVIDNVDEYATTPVTYALPGGKVAITDAITGLAAEVVILAWPEKRHERDSSVFRLQNGRTAVVAGPPVQFTGTIDLFVATDSSRANLINVLQSATAGTVQIRQAGGYADVDCYVSVLSHNVKRWSQDGSDERRIVTLDVAEVSAWSSELLARGYTYADLESVYTGLTYGDLAGDYATYLDLAQAELTP
jgi:hypothetical protein